MTIGEWFKAAGRWLTDRRQQPPPLGGETAVLFCLQTTSPMSFDALQQSTTIDPVDLHQVLENLEAQDRIDVVGNWQSGLKQRLYLIKYPKK